VPTGRRQQTPACTPERRGVNPNPKRLVPNLLSPLFVLRPRSPSRAKAHVHWSKTTPCTRTIPQPPPISPSHVQARMPVLARDTWSLTYPLPVYPGADRNLGQRHVSPSRRQQRAPGRFLNHHPSPFYTRAQIAISGKGTCLCNYLTAPIPVSYLGHVSSG